MDLRVPAHRSLFLSLNRQVIRKSCRGTIGLSRAMLKRLFKDAPGSEVGNEAPPRTFRETITRPRHQRWRPRLISCVSFLFIQVRRSRMRDRGCGRSLTQKDRRRDEPWRDRSATSRCVDIRHFRIALPKLSVNVGRDNCKTESISCEEEGERSLVPREGPVLGKGLRL